MFKLARAMRSTDEAMQPSNVALSWNTSVQFDASLVGQLVARYDELSARFSGVLSRIERNLVVSEHEVDECASQLHNLRHTEALRLYPVIARRLSPDPIARRLFWQSRLVMLGLARRVLRRFDELIRAIRCKAEIAVAADHVAKALAEYRRRNEAEMYPLYSIVGKRSDSKPSQVA